MRAAGVRCLKLPAHSPDLNAFAERFVLSIKSECLNKLIPLGERHLRLAVSEFVEPGRVLAPDEVVVIDELGDGEVRWRSVGLALPGIFAHHQLGYRRNSEGCDARQC